MNPQVFHPDFCLSEYVQCYWDLQGDLGSTPRKNTIVSDGTIKLIFHYGDTYINHREDGQQVLLPKFFLVGQLTKPFVVEPIGITGSFVVRFHPNGFLPFSTIPIKDMENEVVTLDRLFGAKGIELGEKILNSITTTERISFIEEFLVEQLSDRAALDFVVKSAIQTIQFKKGNFKISEFSRHLNIDRRQLGRKFSSNVGLSPKQLSKTIRIQTVLKTLLSQNIDSLTDLAYQNDYFDQAHFIKEFKEFTGLTPKKFYGENLKMSLIFDTIT
ncbi:helix-turn-helix domain-containing protein [Algoriphagus confluentis]|uniref:AraC family transcriptional regulator n=1 Tax=Algoriphagus confluentis TaxID=1697556 RepID=A0ABQ6PU89_9BACT|nr:AraC family transcriptional regulator [Algoriphagus confluentis]